VTRHALRVAQQAGDGARRENGGADDGVQTTGPLSRCFGRTVRRFRGLGTPDDGRLRPASGYARPQSRRQRASGGGGALQGGWGRVTVDRLDRPGRGGSGRTRATPQLTRAREQPRPKAVVVRPGRQGPDLRNVLAVKVLRRQDLGRLTRRGLAVLRALRPAARSGRSSTGRWRTMERTMVGARSLSCLAIRAGGGAPRRSTHLCV